MLQVPFHRRFSESKEKRLQAKLKTCEKNVEGSLRTLRERYEYLLLGSETDQVDFPISPANASQLIHPILESHTSVIVDLYEFLPRVRQRIVREMLEALINAPKTLWHDCLVVIDEAHIFCPERESSEAKSAVEALCSRGRARGYCAVLATQRISKLGKDALGECNNKLIGRASLDIDMKRSNAEIEFSSQSQELKKLTPGEFYAFGPAIASEVRKIGIGPVFTTHPKAGSRRQMSSPPTPASLQAVLAALKSLPNRASEQVEEPAQPREERPAQGAPGRCQPRRGSQTSLLVAKQEPILLAEKDAEIQHLRQQIELLSRITVTLDGKLLPVTELPSALKLESINVEQATIAVQRAVAERDQGAQSSPATWEIAQATIHSLVLAGILPTEVEHRDREAQLQALVTEIYSAHNRLKEHALEIASLHQELEGVRSQPEAGNQNGLLLIPTDAFLWQPLQQQITNLNPTARDIVRILFAYEQKRSEQSFTLKELAARLQKKGEQLRFHFPNQLVDLGLLAATPKGSAHTLYYQSKARMYLRREFAEHQVEPLLQELVRLLSL